MGRTYGTCGLDPSNRVAVSNRCAESQYGLLVAASLAGILSGQTWASPRPAWVFCLRAAVRAGAATGARIGAFPISPISIEEG